MSAPAIDVRLETVTLLLRTKVHLRSDGISPSGFGFDHDGQQSVLSAA